MSFLKKYKGLGLSLYDDHKVPITRRDFLACGLFSASAWAVAPTLSLMNKAQADVFACSSNGGADCGVPYLSFEGAGGMNIAGGNIIVGFDPNESQESFSAPLAPQSIQDYYRLGLPSTHHPSQSGMVNKDYGLHFHSTSGILAGLNDILGTPVDISEEQNGSEMVDLRPSIDGLLICVRSSDDTNGNPTNTVHMAKKAGSYGQLVQIVGDQNTDTGARSTSPGHLIDLKARPTQISNFESSKGLLSIHKDLMSDSFLASIKEGGTDRVSEFLNKIAAISKTRLSKMTEKEGQLIGNSIEGSKGLFKKFGPEALDPSSDPAILKTFGNGTTVSNQTTASIVNLVINRYAGTGALTFGGFDYHDGTASTGQERDRFMGQEIGKAIKFAAIKGRPLFIHLYTDGGVGGDAGGTIDSTGRIVWKSDSGTRSAMAIIVFRPGHDRAVNGPLILKTKKSNNENRERQIGHYLQSSAAVNLTANSIANNITEAWKAVILNYLATQTSTTDDEKVIEETLRLFGERFPGEDLPSDAKDFIRLKSLIS